MYAPSAKFSVFILVSFIFISYLYLCARCRCFFSLLHICLYRSLVSVWNVRCVYDVRPPRIFVVLTNVCFMRDVHNQSFRVRVSNDIVYNVTSDQSVIYYVNVNHIFFILSKLFLFSFCSWWLVNLQKASNIAEAIRQTYIWLQSGLLCMCISRERNRKKNEIKIQNTQLSKGILI